MRKLFVTICLLLPVFSASAGNDAVDLGLSVKWASCNLGASAPEESGNFYAWGEVETKKSFSWLNYKWCEGDANSLSKYCPDSSFGVSDTKTVLDSSDDAASVALSGNWRMPTGDEWEELKSDCTWEWTQINGVNGYKVSGDNGKWIFLPVCGERYGRNPVDAGVKGFYWSSTLNVANPTGAKVMIFSKDDIHLRLNYRFYGLVIRPVSK